MFIGLFQFDGGFLPPSIEEADRLRPEKIGDFRLRDVTANRRDDFAADGQSFLANRIGLLLLAKEKTVGGLILNAGVALMSLFSDVFLTPENLLNQGRLATEIALIALPMTLIIITGGIDLSVGSIAGLTAIMLGVIWHNWGWPLEARLLSITQPSKRTDGTPLERPSGRAAARGFAPSNSGAPCAAVAVTSANRAPQKASRIVAPRVGVVMRGS